MVQEMPFVKWSWIQFTRQVHELHNEQLGHGEPLRELEALQRQPAAG